MSDYKHTQGEWKIIIPEKALDMIFVKTKSECVYLAQRTEETEANAKLIASSPLLLRACEVALKDALFMVTQTKGAVSDSWQYNANMLQTAINKATL